MERKRCYFLEEALRHGQIELQFGQFIEVASKSIGIGVDLFEIVVQLVDHRLEDRGDRRGRVSSWALLRDRSFLSVSALRDCLCFPRWRFLPF